MDLSKLPKLSETAKARQENESAPSADPPVASPAPPPQPSASAAPIGPGLGAEVWIAVIVGLIFLGLGRSFGSYLAAKLSGQPHHTYVNWSTGEKAGQEVTYWELQGHQALSDSGIFLFGVALILEAVVLMSLARRSRPNRFLLSIALTITLLATAYNLVAVFMLFQDGTLPIISLLAVAFGGYIASYEWAILKSSHSAAPERQ